jgi:threonine synthase
MLPFDDNDTSWQQTTMGEGMTAIVTLDTDDPKVLVKLDYAMPTGSFKDRGASVLVAAAKSLGAKRIVEDSSGNAGNAIAAYAARVDIPCDIYVPEGTSPKKIAQIKSHGAVVHVIPGSREDTARATLTAAKENNVFYASHVYNPYFHEGTKTYLYEIFEQLNGSLPDNLVIPVGNGTLLLGVFIALKELLTSGAITHMPKIIAVQSENCAPIYDAFNANLLEVSPVENMGTLAEGIAIALPMRGAEILEAIRSTQGLIITAPEDEIDAAKTYLANRGFHVEPTTAATFAAFFKHRDTIIGSSIIPLCGTGLKKD